MSDDEQLNGISEVVARIPREQCFTWELTPQPGRVLFAETIGQTLVALKDIFAGIHPGGTVVTVLNCGFRENGAFFADLAVLPVDSDKPA